MVSQRVLVLALAACICWGVIGTVTATYYYQQTMTIRSSLVIVSVSIDYGNGTTRVYREVYLSKEATVLDAARSVAKVSTKQYSWGTIVMAINDVPKTSDKFWQFWVNGEYGMTAADATVLRSDDKVEWKLAKSMF